MKLLNELVTTAATSSNLKQPIMPLRNVSGPSMQSHGPLQATHVQVWTTKRLAVKCFLEIITCIQITIRLMTVILLLIDFAKTNARWTRKSQA